MTNFLMGNKILLIQKIQMDNGQAILKCRVYKSKPDILNFSQSVAIILFLFSNKEIQGTGYPALVGDPPILYAQFTIKNVKYRLFSFWCQTKEL